MVKLLIVLAGLGMVFYSAPIVIAGEPADPAPLAVKVRAAGYIFTGVATKMTWIRDGKPLKFTPKLGDLADPVRIELDISEVFAPDAWKSKRHVTILLYHTPRGNTDLITGLLGKKMIYLLEEEADHSGYIPAADQCQPAVPVEWREKVLQVIGAAGH